MRGSRKLQQLQDGPIERPTIGVDNAAYLEDEHEEPEPVIGNSYILGFIWHYSLLFLLFSGYGELVIALQNLHTQLTKHGMAALANRVTAVQGMLLGPGIARVLGARTVVLQRRRAKIDPPVTPDAQTLAKDVCFSE